MPGATLKRSPRSSEGLKSSSEAFGLTVSGSFLAPELFPLPPNLRIEELPVCGGIAEVGDLESYSALPG